MSYLSTMPLDFPYSSARLAALQNGALSVADSPAIFRVEGAGALTCLQGLFTCDLAAAGNDSLSWGALLTSKGMIIFDAFAIREAAAITLVAEAPTRGPALDLFRRTLPPRLARVTDLSETHRVTWQLGRSAPESDGSLPQAGRSARIGSQEDTVVAAGSAVAPFAFLVVGPVGAMTELGGPLQFVGVTQGTEADLAAARILAGWPTLGREIDEKSLPQEVRFDELGGVSYSKGCYTGQETVARIHFRGHVNRKLQGVILEGAGALADRAIRASGKEVGTVRSALLLEDRVMALATIRREIDAGTSLEAGGRTLRVMDIPFAAAVEVLK